MKYLFLLLFSISILSCFAQVKVTIKWSSHKPKADSDTIYYNPSQKLVWQDFKGKAGEPANAAALTSSGFGYRSSIQYVGDKTDIAITVYCYFSKKASWVRAGKENTYTLNHEQHHFDVTYLVTDLFIRKLKAINFTRNNYAMMLEQAYMESSLELEKKQNDYDGQTKNGQVEKIQEAWDKKIQNQLEKLKGLTL